MTEINARVTEDKTPPGRRPRLWLWFVAGFHLVFIGMSLLFSMDFYDGRVLYRTKVWHYYVLEIQRAWNSTGNLGATSGNSEAAVIVAFQHILFSAVGGGAMMGIAWMVRKMSRST